MTMNEAKEFLEKMATNWQMPASEKQAFLDWQSKATQEELQFLDRWHRQFLSRHNGTLDIDDKTLTHNKEMVMKAFHAMERQSEIDGQEELDEDPKAQKESKTDQEEDSSMLTPHQKFRNLQITVKKVSRLAAILLLSIGCFYVIKMVVSTKRVDFVQKENTAETKVNLPPGSNHAILTLANGTQIFLDSTNHRILPFQNGNSVKNLNGNLLSYSQLATVKQVEENKLSTPRGGQYQVQLPDGTHVWLNSASSLVYPTAFVGDTREVQLTGEAYFEVAHREQQPFIVHTRQMEVKVLGTGFNIMAYPEEQAVRTTLVHGSVLVQNKTQEKRITPGQQAILLNNRQDFEIATVNVHQTIAWKEGEFWFKNTSIKNIMRQLSRWYNFDVVYQGDISGIRLSGVLAKHRNAEQLLTILQSTKQVQFDVHGKTIVVRPITD